MGRRGRGRGNSEEDESLEQAYAQKRQKRAETSPYAEPHPPAEKQVQGSSSKKDSDVKEAPSFKKSSNVNESSSSKKSLGVEEGSSSKKNSDVKKSEQDKIEKLRLKKQGRKEANVAKQQQRRKQEEVKKKINDQEVAKKMNEKKEKEKLKKKKAESDDNKFAFLRMGVKYRDLIVGKGPEVKDRKKIRVAYTLRAKNRYGKILDTSEDFGFRLGRGEVIEGWDIGVQGMRQGGKRYLIVPPQAGYGQQNIGGGSGAILFFEVAVLAC
jgi:FKBP-type peptidyl-prolyl cis-trans isomerase